MELNALDDAAPLIGVKFAATLALSSLALLLTTAGGALLVCFSKTKPAGNSNTAPASGARAAPGAVEIKKEVAVVKKETSIVPKSLQKAPQTDSKKITKPTVVASTRAAAVKSTRTDGTATQSAKVSTKKDAAASSTTGAPSGGTEGGAEGDGYEECPEMTAEQLAKIAEASAK